MSYPASRPRRLRATEPLRRLVAETVVRPADLVLPLFVLPGARVRRPVASLPGVEQTSADELLRDAEEAAKLGIAAVLLFGIPDEDSKDPRGTSGWDGDGVVQRATRLLKRELPGLAVITDVCLCEYTDHGHCGILDGAEVDNDATLPLLARMAVSHAAAGADVVAPSDMMDGRVAAIRNGLDDAGFASTPILSYAVKYASGFYGPFRDAAGSAPAFGDRRGYQMDPVNAREALREVRLDVEEGADMVMVKPAVAYLDVIHRLRRAVEVPLFASPVSGEYAMVHAAAERGWLDLERVMHEVLHSIRRAGADRIVTYHARQFARTVP
ncbi:porphobilinogen synthase [soil metagenome]